MSSLEEIVRKKYPKWSEQKHVQKKAMWAGSFQHLEVTEYIYKDEKFINQKVCYPPALYKSIDEAIVNAIDHAVRNRNEKHAVTEIRATFSKSDGKITVYNDGPGIEIVVHPDYGVYVPQAIFGSMRSGSNLDKNDDDITGGTNGVGVKLTNILSEEFEVITVYSGKMYVQKWIGGIDGVQPPKITSAKGKREYTQVSFTPAYKKQFKYTVNMDEIYEQLEPIIAMRMYKAAAYIGWITKGKTKCYYNDEYINVKNMTDLAGKMFPENVSQSAVTICPCSASSAKHMKDADCNKWEIVFAYVENKASSMKSMHQISNVNGVAAVNGRHIEHIFEQLKEGVASKIEVELKAGNIKFQPSYIYNNVFLFINARLPNAEWNDQRKDELTVDKKTLAPYVLPKNCITEAQTYLRNKILESIYEDTNKSPAKKKRITVDKYTPAKLAGGPHSLSCTLILPEGDSAANMCMTGITYKPKGKDKPVLGFDTYGILTLGGVIMNARKDSKVIKVGDKYKVIMTEKLAANKFIKALLEVTGLNVNYAYDPESSTYSSERKLLRYGRILSCVDQDHDGVGFIHSLIMNLFDRFWPKLLEAGYIQRFVTPVRRAVPKVGPIVEFYSESEYRNWLASGVDASQYKFEYIKGLASNKKEDIIYMFVSFASRVYVYKPDKNTSSWFDDYFGDDSEPRKRELRIPYNEPPEELLENQRNTKTISCSDHLLYEAKVHKLANVKQKLYSAVDGMNESGRKIFDGSRKKFKQNNTEIKVAQLAGYISEHEAYHHGEASLQQSIAGKAFVIVGGVQLPQLLPQSSGLGSRNGGSSEISQPRYTFVNLNKRLTDVLYPDADLALLKYVVDDGEIVEPEYYVPILPMAILESVEMPADGWKIKICARNVFDVIQNVRMLIRKGDTDTGLMPMKVYNRGHTGEIKYVRGVQHSFGNYYYDDKKQMVKITELPLRVWSETYTEYIRKHKPLVDDIRNYSNDDYVDIEAYLIDNKGGKRTIDTIMEMGCEPWTDGVEEYFELRKKLSCHLNLIGTFGEVIEFSDYDDVIKYWFNIRKDLYGVRIERQRILWELKILYYENMYRFINECAKTPLANMAEEDALRLLQTNKFVKFNRTLLMSPGLTPTAELKDKILSEKANYDYIFDIRERDKLAKAIAALSDKINKLKSKLRDLNSKASVGKFPGAYIWLEELDAAEKVIKEGFSTDWKFGVTRTYA